MKDLMKHQDPLMGPIKRPSQRKARIAELRNTVVALTGELNTLVRECLHVNDDYTSAGNPQARGGSEMCSICGGVTGR